MGLPKHKTAMQVSRQWATFARCWWLFDAQWQCPFQSAFVLHRHILGLHKPIYHPLSDVGDHVVVINSRDIATKDHLWRTWKHFHHTGYPAGFSATRLYKVHDEDPTKVLYKCVKDITKNTLLRKGQLERLHIYPDENVPSEILKNVTQQIPQIQSVPKRLDQYSAEEREAFPQLFDWPEDYVKPPGKMGKLPWKPSYLRVK